MSTNHHTPYENLVTVFSDTSMNVPLGELDAVLTSTLVTLGEKSDSDHDHALVYSAIDHDHALTYSAIDHSHNDLYYTETELNTSGGGASVHWDNISDKPTVGSGDGDVVAPASNTADYVPQWNGADSKTLADGFPITDAGKALLDDATAADMLVTLGVTQLVLPSAFYPGVPEADAILLYVPIAVATTFPANFAGSICKALVAATAETIIDVQKNGSSVGTITFAAAGTTGTFASSGGAAVSFAVNDDLYLVNQSTADATLASIGTSLYGVR